jgi:hypothetical protein
MRLKAGVVKEAPLVSEVGSGRYELAGELEKLGVFLKHYCYLSNSCIRIPAGRN